MSGNVCDIHRRIIDDTLNLGKQKPVSYLPIETVEVILGMDRQEFMKLADARGLHHLVATPDACCIKSGAIFVYDAKTLALLLEKNRNILYRSGWSVDITSFVKRIALEWLDSDHPVAPVVRAAFGNPQGPS